MSDSSFSDSFSHLTDPTSLEAVRTRLRAWRKALPEDVRQKAADNVCALLQAQDFFTSSKHVGCYLAQEGELDPMPIMQQAQSEGRQLYLPVMDEHKEVSLKFLSYRSGDRLVENQYGISEPAEALMTLAPWKLDCVLLPLVAFDQHCHRIGRGAGYYDRCFAFVNELPKEPRPSLVGLAYAGQKIADLVPNSWDVPMDYIITDQAVFSATGPRDLH